MTTSTYKWTLNTLCTLQASCRYAAGQAGIQPSVWNQNSAIEKVQTIFFFKHWEFSFYIATVTPNPVLKTALKGLSNKGAHSGKSHGIMESHAFKSWFENGTLSSWPHDFSHCVPLSFENPCHALFRTGLIFMIALLGGLVAAKPLRYVMVVPTCSVNFWRGTRIAIFLFS